MEDRKLKASFSAKPRAKHPPQRTSTRGTHCFWEVSRYRDDKSKNIQLTKNCSHSSALSSPLNEHLDAAADSKEGNGLRLGS